MNKGKTQEELKEEMFEDWLWEESYNELRNKSIEEVEKELGFWKSMIGCKKKISERHNLLFKQKIKKLEKTK